MKSSLRNAEKSERIRENHCMGGGEEGQQLLLTGESQSTWLGKVAVTPAKDVRQEKSTVRDFMTEEMWNSYW